MALTLAIPLAGLDIDEFHGVHFLVDRFSLSPNEQPISPSAKSDSSGIGSLTTTTITDITPSLSPVSRSDTPSDDGNNARPINRLRLCNSTPAKRTSDWLAELCRLDSYQPRVNSSAAPQICQPIARPHPQQSAMQELHWNVHPRVVHGNRDILNLEANLRPPYWRMMVPEMPRHNIPYYMENRSIYHRLGDYGLTEEYPMTYCEDCNFGEPTSFVPYGLRYK